MNWTLSEGQIRKSSSGAFGPTHAKIRSIMRRTLSLAVFAAALCGQIKTGPAVGDGVPDFAAPDQAGRTQTLKSIMGPKGAMLVFFRSADW